MNESTEQLKAILDGKPDGATHVDAEGFYWVFNGFTAYVFDKVKQGLYTPVFSLTTEQFRSLADIAEIVALREKLSEAIGLIQKTGELQEIGDEMLNEIRVQAVKHSLADTVEIVVLREEVERLKAEANEIRAQAVEDFMDWVNSNFKRGRDIWSMAEEYANNLRNQVKEQQ